MIECLSRVKRVARKPHTCDFCGGIIAKAEQYDYGKYKDDMFYEWKTHLKCSFISSELWDIVDPDYGMSEEDFHEACREIIVTVLIRFMIYYKRTGLSRAEINTE